jgi:hypothetical protein
MNAGDRCSSGSRFRSQRKPIDGLKEFSEVNVAARDDNKASFFFRYDFKIKMVAELIDVEGRIYFKKQWDTRR